MSEREKYVVIGGMLCEDIGKHNCVGDTDGCPGAHESHCGLEPLGYVDQLIEAVPRTITTAEELTQLSVLAILLYDDTANGGDLRTYCVPDDGTVMFHTGDPAKFHFCDFAADEYVTADKMPLPVTVLREHP